MFSYGGWNFQPLDTTRRQNIYMSHQPAPHSNNLHHECHYANSPSRLEVKTLIRATSTEPSYSDP